MIYNRVSHELLKRLMLNKYCLSFAHSVTTEALFEKNVKFILPILIMYDLQENHLL